MHVVPYDGTIWKRQVHFSFYSSGAIVEKMMFHNRRLAAWVVGEI